MKIIFGVLIVCCLLVCGCKENQGDTKGQYMVEKLEFDINKQTVEINADSIEIKEIIRLSPDADMPVGHVDKIVVTTDRVFVLDRTLSKYLFVYSKQGNLLYKIGDKGNGPGEYLNTPKDFHVDESLKEIIVFDSEIKTLYTYDWDGQLIHTKVLRVTWPYAFTKADSLFYFAYRTTDADSYLLRIEDENENTYFKYKHLNNKRDVVANECFYNTPQYIYFVEDFNNDVVVLKGKSIEKILSFDFGNHSIEKDFLTKYKGDNFIDKALANGKATNIRKIVETDRLFAFQYVFMKKLFQIIYDKNTRNYLNGLTLSSGFFPNMVQAGYNNHLVSVLSAEYIDTLLNVKEENPDGWNQIIASAHPVIKKILLESKIGRADDYVFIYDLHV